jgi:two-component system cell cycle sensor histidine kinase/response regulator CckA
VARSQSSKAGRDVAAPDQATPPTNRALHDELELYKLVAESSSDLISLLSSDGTILYASPSHERHLGLKPADLIGKKASAFAHPDDVATFAAASQATAALAEHRGIVRYRHRDGNWAVLEANVSGVPANAGGAAVVVVARDVTERVAAEETLREREALYRALLTNGSDLIAILSEAGDLMYQSPSGKSVFGYEPETLIGTSVFELLHPDDLVYGTGVFAAVVADPTTTRINEVRFRRGDGGWAVGECTVTNMLDNPAVRGIVVNTRDITERAQAEADLRESERRFRAVFQDSLDALLLVDDDRVFLDANRAACELFATSHDQLVGRRLDDFAASPKPTEAMWEAFLADGHREGEWVFVRADGAERLADYRGTAHVLPGQHLSAIRDITDRRRLEEQLRQAQKMEAVGQLAGGIAHDFNNLLTVVAGSANLALERPDTSAAVQEDLVQIRRAAGRAAELTQQLLAFSRRQTLRPIVVQPNELVNDATPMLERLIGAHIEFQVVLDPDLRLVFADASGIEQILMNLALNAAQAMPKGGTLTIATANVPLGDVAARNLEVDPGDYVAVSVSDTGGGMAPETAAQAFEPFFTTKDPGAGTGLGLATVHGITKQTGGGVRLDSEIGRGTTVTVYLPATDATAVADTNTDDGEHVDVSGTETVLVVDDNESIRRVVAQMLALDGYDVVTAATPADAIRMVEQGFRPHVLVSDVVMPKIGGLELAERLVELHPDMQVVLTSGYAEHGLLDAEESMLARRPLFVQKPFSSAELAGAIRKALDR